MRQRTKICGSRLTFPGRTDEMASAILVTTSEELAHKVSDEIDGFLNQLSRKEIMEKSLDSFGYILVASDMKEAIDTGKRYCV